MLDRRTNLPAEDVEEVKVRGVQVGWLRQSSHGQQANCCRRAPHSKLARLQYVLSMDADLTPKGPPPTLGKWQRHLRNVRSERTT